MQNLTVMAVLLSVCLAPGAIHAQVFRGYSSTGSLEFKSQKDKRREIIKGYYSNGQLEFVASYRKGKLDGDIKEYYENGMLKAEISYDKGKRDGMAKFYYENGMLMCKVYYEDNRERRAKFYDKNGLLTTSIDVDRSGIKVRKRHERRIRDYEEKAEASDSMDTQ